MQRNSDSTRQRPTRSDDPLWFRVWLCVIVLLFTFVWPTWTGGIVIVGGGYTIGLLVLRRQRRRRRPGPPERRLNRID